ncbi:MAG: AAA family ATPase [Patescibacteria group bacterium]
MNLKSLEIAGFKSFAKKVTLEFNCPITAIVGPNGSGKSNVAEAFRFVLGEQSIKSLRGKRGEDLIYNGGKSATRQNRASVKVTFDNKDRVLNIDFDEVTLERVVHRDSANEYFINGSGVRLKDIHELLAGAHIGASGHHIISQGEADRILNANLKERREMIEEALGLKVYHFKREESERKLDKTVENLKQVYSLRKEIAPHLRFLEKQVEKVEKAREMRVQLEGMYKDYFKRESLYIRNETARLSTEKQGPEARKKQLEEELARARQILSEADNKDIKSDELLSLESKLQETRSERDTLTREIGRVEGQIASEERILRKQQELASSNDTKTVLLKDVESVAQTAYQQIQDAEAKEDVGALKEILRGIKSLLSEFISKNRTHTDTSAIQESEQEISKLKEERETYSGRLSGIRDAETQLNTQYAALQLEIEREKDTNREAEKMVFKIMAEQNEVHSHLRSIQAEEDRIQTIDADFQRELQEAAVLVGRVVLDFEQHELEELVQNYHEVRDEKRKNIERIKIRLEDSGAAGGEDVLREFQETQDRDAFLAKEIEDLEKSAETLRVLIKDLEEKLTLEFKAGVEKINKQFQEFFALMFGGGTASLQVIREQKRRRKSETELMSDESDEEFVEEEGEEGIEISVNLPQKRVKALMMLSGGERALTSIALLFAISQVNPPPFIILDETDAALDEANSRKYGEMISNLAQYSQLILITHNRETMSRAGILYGVTMSSEGSSKLLSIQFDEAVAVAK